MMVTLKAAVIGLIVVLPLASMSAALAQPKDANLREGTRVVVTTVDRLGDGARRGDIVRLEVDRDVKDADGNVAIEAGAEARGEVVLARRGDLFHRSVLEVRAVKARSVNGDWVPLSGTLRREGTWVPGTTF